MQQRSSSSRGMSGAEWLFVLLLVVVVLSLLIPRINSTPQFAPNVKQKAQLRSIDTALELLSNEWGDYPPSDANDDVGQAYCGAMKLAEAIMGQDLLGFHVASGFRADGFDPNGGTILYGTGTLSARRGPYLQPENANAYRLADIYGEGNTGPFPGDLRVMCDVYTRKRPSGKKTGMPILYYRADPNGMLHDVNDPDNPANIYHWRDNQALVELGVPGEPSGRHPLADPHRFYLNTQSDKTSESQPFRGDSYILLSAGEDGLYGTADDICNFDWSYRKR